MQRIYTPLTLPFLFLLLILTLTPSPTNAKIKLNNNNNNKNAPKSTFDFSENTVSDSWSSSSSNNNKKKNKKGGQNSDDEGCKLSGGVKLGVGENWLDKKHDENCTVFVCEKEGLRTVEAQCPHPLCYDYRLKGEKACCASCPKGRNCLLPDKTVLWGNNVTRYGNALCRCPKITRGLGWGENVKYAVCREMTTLPPTTTTPVPDCRMPDDEKELKSMEPGKTMIVPSKDDNCRKYMCDVRGQLTTYYGTCPALNCSTNGTRAYGECCKTCPDDDYNSTASENVSYSTAPPAGKKRRKVVYIDLMAFFKLLFFGHHGGGSNSQKHGGSHVTKKGGNRQHQHRKSFYIVFYFSSSSRQHHRRRRRSLEAGGRIERD